MRVKPSSLLVVVGTLVTLSASTTRGQTENQDPPRPAQHAASETPLVRRSGKNTLVFDHRRLRTVMPGDGLAVLTADDGAYFQVIFECTAPNLFNYNIVAREEFLESERPSSTTMVSEGVRVSGPLGMRQVAMRHYARYNRYRVSASLRAGVSLDGAPGPLSSTSTPAAGVAVIGGAASAGQSVPPGRPTPPARVLTDKEVEVFANAVLAADARAAATASEAARFGGRAVSAARETVMAEQRALEAQARADTAEGTAKEAEALRAAAERARIQAENARVAAEQRRVGAEQARAAAEAARAAAEQARSASEASRRVADARRAELEVARQEAEATRAAQELARKDAEAARLVAEESRAAAESARSEAESARQAAERARQESEAARANARLMGTVAYDCGQVDGGTVLHPFEFDLWVETRPEWRFGAIAGVGRSGLASPRYAIRTNPDGSKTFVEDATQDSLALDTLALANIYYSRTFLRTLNLGLAFGIGSSGSAPRYFFGPSLVFGKYFVLHGGWALGSVAAPPVGQQIGAPPINGDNTLNALSSRVTSRPYLGLGFTWVNRTQQFDEALSASAKTTGNPVALCSLKVAKTDIKLGATKGSAETFSVEASDGCAWTAAFTSEVPISVVVKDKTVTLTATQELKADLSATLRVSGKGAAPMDVKVSVAQNCFNVNTTPLALSTARLTGNIEVLAGPACEWVAQWKNGASGGFTVEALGLRSGTVRLDVRAPAGGTASEATLQFLGRQSGAAGPVVEIPVKFVP